MEWAKITPSELIKAAEEHGLAVLPVGSMEAHGDFLPLGNDTFKVNQACIDAALAEAAVVLPPQYSTDVKSMQMMAGAVSMELRVLIDYLENLLDEIGRNGFRKILIVSGHGGNRTWLNFIRSELATRNKPYVVYTYYMSLIGREENRSLLETAVDCHGGEVETSIAMHLFPELVHPERFFAATEPAQELDFATVEFSNDWTMNWPEALCGDPRPASAAKGRVFYESCVEVLAEAFKKIKEDAQVAAFTRDFQTRRMRPGVPGA